MTTRAERSRVLPRTRRVSLGVCLAEGFVVLSELGVSGLGFRETTCLVRLSGSADGTRVLKANKKALTNPKPEESRMGLRVPGLGVPAGSCRKPIDDGGFQTWGVSGFLRDPKPQNPKYSGLVEYSIFCNIRPILTKTLRTVLGFL